MENREDNPTERSKLLTKPPRCSSSTMESTSSTSDLISDGNVNSNLSLSWQKLRFYLVEPTILILVFAYNLSATVWKNQIIYQTCTVIFQYNITDCRQLSTRNTSVYIKSIETEVQSYTVIFFMTSSLIQSIVPALCGVFIGAWSDRFGRKPLLIASFVGYFSFYSLTCIISHLSSMFDVNPWFYLIPSIPLSLLGDGVTYAVAAFCYISDVSTASQRPYRMAWYEAVIYIGLMLGSLSSGFIYEAYNSSTLIYLISSICIFCATLIVIFVIPESLNARQKMVINSGENTNGTTNNSQQENQNNQEEEEEEHEEEKEHHEEQENRQNSTNRYKKLFDIEHIKSMYVTCFKPRDFEMRTILLLIVSCLLICAFIVEGSITVFYLFVREKFQWTVKEFTTYETFSILIPIFGNIVGILLLRKIFKLQLLSVAILGLTSHVCGSMMKGFAAANWQLYLAIVLGVFKSISNPMLRTVLTNLLPANELGKIFSFISAIQAFMPFVASPLYTIIYRATLVSFPGFFNVINANLFMVAICLVLVILRKKQKYPEPYNAILN